ncbi:MAG: hypothetical protein M3Y48_09755 [Actinomycetota bacterium]|nr:hypothetical protein [Actinomycetota bacterium]
MINAALAGAAWDRLGRTRLLPDQVTIALAVNDLDTAEAATSELTESAQTYGSKPPPTRASLAWAPGWTRTQPQNPSSPAWPPAS